jgi:hypothetical protein
MARLVSAAPVQTGSRSARADTLARARRPENHAAVFASAGRGYPRLPYLGSLRDEAERFLVRRLPHIPGGVALVERIQRNTRLETKMPANCLIPKRT